MVADYDLLRRRRFNVSELYRLDGQYRDVAGMNPAGFVAGGIAAWVSQYAFVIGFRLGLLIYASVMKLVVLKSHPQGRNRQWLV
jgi:NCS1 family nucleobase:cation symporter-1